MTTWHINGGKRLEGQCFVQGAKNAALPILAASVMSPCKATLMNVPQLSDVETSLDILRELGCTVRQQKNDVTIDPGCISSAFIPCEMMERMRSSVLFMGALLARCGEAELCAPGGCDLGSRPIDLHLQAMKSLGAEVICRDERILCRAKKLRGAVIRFPFPSVGATENAMLAACGAEGETVIYGAAREPEIVDLQEFLRKCGAYIYGAGTDCIVIRGFAAEAQCGHRIMPDRIAASTLLCAAAACGGEIELCGVDYKQFYPLQLFLNAAGCDIIHNSGSVRLRSDGRLKAVGPVSTAPYPGFPTDAQPLLMASLLRAEGSTVFSENIFSSRYRHVNELKKLGADIAVKGQTAVVRGVKQLHGAEVRATDLRGGAALIIAGLSAEGTTRLSDSGHIGRGYEGLDHTLRFLGADIFTEN